jgi:chromosomal replication initiator protein
MFHDGSDGSAITGGAGIDAVAPQSWLRVKSRLRAELGDDVFSSWFGRLEVQGLDNGALRLSVPTRFLKSWLETHYAEKLQRHCLAEFKGSEAVQICVRQHAARSAVQPAAQRTDRPHAQNGTFGGTFGSTNASPVHAKTGTGTIGQGVPDKTTVPGAGRTDGFEADGFGSPLDKRLTFSSFLVGKSNALAFAAADRVASTPGATALYNPLYIHAGVGLGKTHLLQAIAHEGMKLGRRVAYFTADRFMYGFVAALKNQTALTFKERLRDIDILIVDDVQFIQGRQIQQEFGHTLNALIDAGRQIIVAADRLPMELDALDERIRSRLAGGLAVEVGGLDDELRVKILNARITALKGVHPSFDVSPEVISFIAHSVSTNGRDLDGAANRLLAHTTLTGTPLTVEAAEAAIRDLIRSREPKRLKIEDIQKLVATRYNVSRADILSERRTAAVVRPRQIAMFLSKTLTPRSLPEIGRRFGGRDHTTVLHAVRKIEKAVGEDRGLNEEVELLKRMLLD